MKKLLGAIVCVCLLTGIATAQETDGRQRAKNLSQQAFTANQTKFAGNGEVMVKPGLLADRKAKTVTLWCAATGVKPSDPVEFLLIGPASGKDYEAMAVTFASPEDVDEALKFIGLKPGRAVDYKQMFYWARGPEVAVTFGWTDKAGQQQNQPVQALLLNARTNKAWEGRMLYTGSRWVTTPEGQKMWLAGTSDSAAIGSTYSDPASVLDVADRSPQADVYGAIKPMPSRLLDADTPLIAVLKPAGTATEVDLTLTVNQVDGKMRTTLTDGEKISEGGWVETLGRFEQMVGDHKIPFVTIQWGGGLPVDQAVKAAALLGGLEGPTGIRIEPPARGQLYFKALLPDPKWRDPKQRVFNGWDVDLTKADAITAVEREDVKDEQTGVYSTVATSHTVADGAALAKLLAERDGARPRDVYVHVPAAMTCGQLNALIAPSLDHHPTVYVFVN